MRRLTFTFALLLLTTPTCACQTVGPQEPAGAWRPVRPLPGPGPRTAEASIDSFELQQPVYGRYGIGFWNIDGEPSRGAQYFVEAKLSPQEVIATAKFEAIDESGKVILLIGLFRVPAPDGDSEFYGLMRVPNQPFRVRVSGNGVDGASYSSLHDRLFRPTNRPPVYTLGPPGAKRSQRQSDKLIENIYRDTAADLEKKVGKSPNGVIVLPHARVSHVSYAPLLSKAGRPLGIRISYDADFSEDGYYNPELHVLPRFEQEDWRGLVEMRVLDGSITPIPEEAGSPQVQPNLLAYGAGYLYRAGTTYHFIADLAPDYIVQNENKTSLCFYNQKFRYSPKSEAAWLALLANKSSTKYSVYIGNRAFAGEIDDFYNQATFYSSLLAEGAKDCVPMGRR